MKRIIVWFMALCLALCSTTAFAETQPALVQEISALEGIEYYGNMAKENVESSTGVGSLPDGFMILVCEGNDLMFYTPELSSTSYLWSCEDTKALAVIATKGLDTTVFVINAATKDAAVYRSGASSKDSAYSNKIYGDMGSFVGYVASWFME